MARKKIRLIVYFALGFSCSLYLVLSMANLSIFVADGGDGLRLGRKSLSARRFGWSGCGEASSGVEAVRLTLKLKPDIVILGLDMPEHNGIEATRQIIRS